MTNRIEITPAAFDAAVAATTLEPSKTLRAARLVLVDGWTITDAAKRFGTTRQYTGKVVRTIKDAALGQGVCPMCGRRLK